MENFISSQNTSSISCNFSSSLENIDRAIDTIKNFLASIRVAINQFELVFVLREALNNAVIHGNANDSDLQVDCSLRMDQDILTIVVTDQGKGFDWQKQLTKSPVSSSTPSGRGLKSIEHYGFTMRFNDAGNTLYLTKKIR